VQLPETFDRGAPKVEIPARRKDVEVNALTISEKTHAFFAIPDHAEIKARWARLGRSHWLSANIDAQRAKFKLRRTYEEKPLRRIPHSLSA
jgi:hypothetical protein